MKRRSLKLAAVSLALIMTVGTLVGCAKTDNGTKTDSGKSASQELYFMQQEVRKSPEWVTKLDAAKDAEQLI